MIPAIEKAAKSFIWVFVVALVFITGAAQPAVADENGWVNRLEKGSQSFGLQLGLGFTDDFSSVPNTRDGIDLSFLFLFPNYRYNLTGLIGSSWYRGALNWQPEAGFATILNKDGEYLFGISPFMLQYQFENRKRNWAPNILFGAGGAYSNWNDVATRELGGELQFLLHAGAGVEFFRDEWSYSVNYRLFHISNGGFEEPNRGLNAHVLSFGLRF